MNEYNPKADQKRKNKLRKIRRLCWVIVEKTLFRFSPFICWGWRRFLLRCFGAKIAKTATIGRLARIEDPWNLTMGERSMICNHTWIMCQAPVILEEQVLVGEYTKILTGSHQTNSLSYKGIVSGVTIKKNAWVASNAMLISGGYKTLKIGEGAVISAGAVVFNNVKPMAIMIGNPAKHIADREFNKD